MNERKIIDRKFFADLVKEVGLNASHLEALGESRQWEIVVSGDMLERLVEIQHLFERLVAMGDDEYRGFYIEVPRPTLEEWGYAAELIASGEYDSREAFLISFDDSVFVVICSALKNTSPDYNKLCSWVTISSIV